MDDPSLGEICDPRWKTSVKWKIQNYFSLSQKADTFIQSPTFHFSNASWYLRIFPNGQRSQKSVEWMSLFLGMLNSEDEEVPVKYTMGIKSSDGGIYVQASSFYFFNKERKTLYGYPTFTKRSELHRNRYKIASGDILTIFCVASNWKHVTDAASQTVSAYGTNALSQDYHRLLHSERKSDVIIKVKNQTFRAHKLILGTRSSVLAAMFEHDMKENSSGVVNITDCDPDTFQDFLLFIYTGKIEKLSSKNVSQLFMLSDKYDLSDLREMCMNFLKDNLCLDMACEVMAIADKHDEKDLKTLAKELIINNIKTLIPTEQWISFMRDNPMLAADLLMTVIPDTES